MSGYAAASALNQAREAIQGAVIALWTAIPRDPKYVFLEGRKFDPPERGYYLKCEINFGASEPITSTGRKSGKNIRRGLLLLTVYGPKHAGMTVFLDVCARYTHLLERGRIDEVTFEGSTGPDRVDEDAATGRQMSFPFYFYENITPS